MMARKRYRVSEISSDLHAFIATSRYHNHKTKTGCGVRALQAKMFH